MGESPIIILLVKRIMNAEIKVISICDVPGLDSVSFDQSGEILKVFCENNNAIYYAKPKEDFSIAEAKRLAIENGKSAVVVEDLS